MAHCIQTIINLEVAKARVPVAWPVGDATVRTAEPEILPVPRSSLDLDRTEMRGGMGDAMARDRIGDRERRDQPSRVAVAR
jgi:hypothetical protein